MTTILFAEHGECFEKVASCSHCLGAVERALKDLVSDKSDKEVWLTFLPLGQLPFIAFLLSSLPPLDLLFSRMTI